MKPRIIPRGLMTDPQALICGTKFAAVRNGEIERFRFISNSQRAAQATVDRRRAGEG